MLGDNRGFDASPKCGVEPPGELIEELWHRTPARPQRRIPV
jgi:hypothetical protein